ncbi:MULTISPECIES: hypothetical protein [unclassified Streptomyces]|uniref:hypothetical protein n=1 Tax=unclassified Streptomyces TaxID=2593676 RepID=UPI003437AEF7
MSQTERPVEGRPDQEEQARLIVRTGNGPTVDNETELLREQYGAPDMAGVFRATDPSADQDDEPAASEASESGTEGGESA